MITQNEKIAYLSGIIDGEGSISIELQKSGVALRKINYYAVRLVIVNTSLPLLQWIESNFGGKITKRAKIVNRRTCYQWALHSFNAAQLLTLCLPFLIEKKERAQILIRFMAIKSGHYLSPEVIDEREKLFLLCKKLNKEKNGEPAPCALSPSALR